MAIISDGNPLEDVTVLNQEQTAFGELAVSNFTPYAALQFPYNLNPALVHSRANQSGANDVNNNMARLQTGAAANSSGQILSKQLVRYNPGQGGLCRFTAMFTAGAANSTQLAGIGDTSDGFFFGYSGTTFGTMVRQGGEHEVRVLTVSTKSTTAENVTITLDGDAIATIAVTDASSGDTTTTANDIAAGDYSSVGGGWDAHAEGSTVVFVSWTAETQSGTYTLSSATTAIGTFAQSVVGTAPTDTFTASTAWNGDPLPFTMDLTKGNVFQIRYQWLGFGSIEFACEDPATGHFIIVHRVKYSNANTRPSIDNPTLPLYAGAVNAANTSNLTMSIGSMVGGTEGSDPQTGIRHGFEGTTSAANTVLTPIITVKNNLVHQSRNNRTRMKVVLVSAAVDHTKPVILEFWANATLTGAVFSDYNAAVSCTSSDTTASAMTGGVFLFSLPLGRTGSTIFSLDERTSAVFMAGDMVTVGAKTVSGTGADATVTLNVIDLF